MDKINENNLNPTNKEKIIAELERLKHYGTIPYDRDIFEGVCLIESFINSLPSEQPSEDLVDAARDIRDTLYLEEGKRDDYGNPYFLQDTIMKAVIAGANFQKERDIKKACEWLKMCVDVDDEVKMVNGEPEAHSFIQKIRHRTEVANQIIGDFKKFMDE